MDQLKSEIADFRKNHPGWTVSDIEENAFFVGWVESSQGAGEGTHRVIVRDPKGRETAFTFTSQQLSQVPQWLVEVAFEYEQGF